MSDHNNISDKEINNLLKQRLLEQDDNALLEAAAKLAFGTEPLTVPSVEKEKKLIEKLSGKKTAGIFKKWVFPGTLIVTVLSTLFYYGFNKTCSLTTLPIENKKTSKQQTSKEVSDNAPALKIIDGDTIQNDFIKHLSRGIYRGQIVEKILKENADCTSPILIKDTIVFSPHTPKGSGNEKEIFGNQPDDLLYFEKEHNTVWYKFSALETGQLTFDIIPVDPNDDYDFMLYKWTGGDFKSKVINKQIKPIRTCISRNDKKIKSMTGLFIDLELPAFVHSGEGVSYVKYINVKKGETFYLLVDNVYNNGNGHTIHMHYKPVKPGESYVGQKNVLANVTFKDSDDEFRPGTRYVEAIDSLYKFLLDNPGIKIEVQGHVNSNGVNKVTKVDGKPYHNEQELSQLRAEAVCKILYKKGVDPERLVPHGYAGRMKKVEDPKTKEECYKNIRVEVLIMSLDYKKDLEYIKKHQLLSKNKK